MSRLERILHCGAWLAIAALLVLPIIFAPVMREKAKRRQQTTELVCHTDPEQIDGATVMVEKCNEETFDS